MIDSPQERGTFSQSTQDVEAKTCLVIRLRPQRRFLLAQTSLHSSLISHHESKTQDIGYEAFT
jgi:hypothetical protein